MLLLAFACAGPDSEQLNKARQRVMDTHDSVMPLISKVLSLRRELNHRIDSCTDTAEVHEMQQLTYQLTMADDRMMSWMRAYTEPEPSDTAMAYLSRQQAIISEVAVLIRNGINNAQQYLDEHPTP